MKTLNYNFLLYNYNLIRCKKDKLQDLSIFKTMHLKFATLKGNEILMNFRYFKYIKGTRQGKCSELL